MFCSVHRGKLNNANEKLESGIIGKWDLLLQIEIEERLEKERDIEEKEY
jgi:hypothetical protein